MMVSDPYRMEAQYGINMRFQDFLDEEEAQSEIIFSLVVVFLFNGLPQIGIKPN